MKGIILYFFDEEEGSMKKMVITISPLTAIGVTKLAIVHFLGKDELLAL